MSEDTIWHQLRSENVGGSEIAALFGQCPYMSHYKLWQIKKGIIPPDDLSDNERVMAGNYMEPAIIKWANDKWETNFVRPNIYIRHPTIVGMGCTPDGIWTLDETTGLGIMCQIKNVDGLEFNKKWEAEGDTITVAPIHIIMQCQHELYCSGMQETHLIVCIGGNRLVRMIIQTDEEFGKECSIRVISFWNSINMDLEPTPDFEIDGDVLKAVRRLKPEVAIIDMTGNNQLYDAAIQYKRSGEIEKAAEEQKKKASAIIMYLTGNTKLIKCGDIEINMVENSGVADKTITAEMVGTVIKGKKAFSYPKIKEPTGA